MKEDDIMLEHAYGWLSIIPPLIAITLAITTKEVLGSLLLGVISGYAIYVNFAPPSILETLEITNPVLGPLNETINAMLEAAGDRDNLALLFSRRPADPKRSPSGPPLK